MKNPFLFVLGVIVGIILFTLMFVISVFGETATSIYFFVLVTYLLVLTFLNMKKNNWKCTKCGEIFAISSKEYLFSINLVDSKKLHCPKCNKKTICEMHKKK